MKIKISRAAVKLLGAILGLSAINGLTSQAAQASVFYETSGDLVLGIGDQTSSLFDKISLGPYASTFVAPQTKVINPLTFVVGVNTTMTAPYTADGDLTETFAVDGVTDTVNIPFEATIDSGVDEDSLSVPSATFTVGGYKFVTVPLEFVNEPDNPGLYTQYLEATISVAPEPLTWALMIVGFGIIGATLRFARRRRSLAAA